MKVKLYVSPGFMLPELKDPSLAVTVCGTESALVHTTVLFNPRTTVTLLGVNPVELGFVPEPDAMFTFVILPTDVVVELTVLDE